LAELDDLTLLINAFQLLPVFCYPSNKSICTTAMNNGSGSRWAREFNITCKQQKPIFYYKFAVCNEIFSLRQNIRVALCGRTFFQYSS